MPTSDSSCSVKIFGKTKFLKGTSRIRTNGKARAAGDDLTAHRTATQRICAPVNKCIFSLLTCNTNKDYYRVTRCQVRASNSKYALIIMAEQTSIYNVDAHEM